MVGVAVITDQQLNEFYEQVGRNMNVYLDNLLRRCVLGSDIDDINEAYEANGGGKEEAVPIRPSWWNKGDHDRDEVAVMVGRAVQAAWEMSAGQDLPIRRIEVNRRGLVVHVLRDVHRAVRLDGTAVAQADVDKQIGLLRGRIDALGRFHG